jgi:hypothetical protein
MFVLLLFHTQVFTSLTLALSLNYKGVTKTEPVVIEINQAIKNMTEQVLLPSPSLCDKVLEALDNRADFEIQKTKTIKEAIVTLKVALDIRKLIMEKNLLSISRDRTEENVVTASVFPNNGSKTLGERQQQHALDPLIRRSARSLLILSRCFHEIGKHKCGQQAKREADALFRTKRLYL